MRKAKQRTKGRRQEQLYMPSSEPVVVIVEATAPVVVDSSPPAKPVVISKNLRNAGITALIASLSISP